MNPWYLLVLLLGLGACARQQEPLVVKQFKILDHKIDLDSDSMVRCEKQRRLHGAVSIAERNERLGVYYTLIWNDPAGVGTGDVELLFEYQQGATASRVKRLVKHFNSSETSGEVEFSVIGNDYVKNGRVLAWKTTLRRGGRVLVSRQSHLWQ